VPQGVDRELFDTRKARFVAATNIRAARKALEEKSFADVVRTAILFGEDADTTAAVTCGLAGIRFGLSGIPKRWLRQLRGFELVEPMIPQFLERTEKKRVG
jgi:ADP-ribosylglycohydrolase